MSRANALSQASQWAAVAVLVLVALLLRGRGMDHGLPHWIEPDAELAEQVEHLRGDGQGARGAASRSRGSPTSANNRSCSAA